MYTLKITPRFGDLDGLRHVNNTKLPEWFEAARTPIYRLFNPKLDLDNWNLILAHLSVDFLAQIFLGSDVEVRTWIVRIGNSSLRIRHEAWQDGRARARGEVVLVHYDFAAQKSVRVPDPIREALAPHFAPEGAAD